MVHSCSSTREGTPVWFSLNKNVFCTLCIFYSSPHIVFEIVLSHKFCETCVRQAIHHVGCLGCDVVNNRQQTINAATLNSTVGLKGCTGYKQIQKILLHGNYRSLTNMCNQSFQRGVFPDSLKFAGNSNI